MLNINQSFYFKSANYECEQRTNNARAAYANSYEQRANYARTTSVNSPANYATRPSAQCTRAPWRTGVMGLPLPLATCLRGLLSWVGTQSFSFLF